MAPGAELGIEDVPLRPGDHVCGLFFGWFDRDEVMVPFVRSGLTAGDCCIMVVDRPDAQTLVEDLGAPEETEDWMVSGQLQLVTSSEQPAGDLHHDHMVAMWQQALAGAGRTSPSGFVRLGGEASWWTPSTSPDELVRYESELNRYVTKDMAVLCLYDLSRFSSEVIIDAVVAHPVLLVGDRVVENPWYVAPDGPSAGSSDRPDRPTMDEIAACTGLNRRRAG